MSFKLMIPFFLDSLSNSVDFENWEEAMLY